VAALVPFGQSRDATGCGSNIVSPTVVATFCGHRLNGDEMLDLLILWRGKPGWFLRGAGGASGGGGSNRFGAGTKGHIAQHSTYGEVTISFDADFDANTAVIGDAPVALDGVNTVLVDDVDAPGSRRISATRWTEPRLPLVGDVHLALARRSRELLNYLQCDIPMPAAPAGRASMPRPPIVTVCEKLRSK